MKTRKPHPIRQGPQAQDIDDNFDAAFQAISELAFSGQGLRGVAVNASSTFGSGTVVLSGGSNISLSTAGSTISIIGEAPLSAGISTFGNTGGTTGFASKRLVLAGMGAVTLSQSITAGSVTLSVSAPVQTAESNTFGMSDIGNTSGTTGVISGNQLRMILAGGNNVTLRQSIDGASATITINAAAGGGGGGGSFSLGVSTLGNTVGDTGTVSQQVVLAGINNITLSQATNTAGATVTISGGNGGPVISFFDNMGPVTGFTGFSQQAPNFNTVYIQPINPFAGYAFPGNMTVSTVLLDWAFTAASNQSSSFSSSFHFGIYTRVNSTQLGLLYKATTALTAGAATSNSALMNGHRFVSFHSSLFSDSAGNTTTPVLIAGSDYYMARLVRSSNFSVAAAQQGEIFQAQGVQRSGTFGVSAATATSMNVRPLIGAFISTTTQLPATINAASLSGPENIAHFAQHLILNNIVSSF